MVTGGAYKKKGKWGRNISTNFESSADSVRLNEERMIKESRLRKIESMRKKEEPMITESKPLFSIFKRGNVQKYVDFPAKILKKDISKKI